MALLSGWRRRRQAVRAPQGPLRGYLAHPEPDRGTSTDDLRLLALDYETTGLDPATDRILTMGFVPVDGRQIDLAGARHLIVRQDREVGHSATVHGVTDDVLARGVPLPDALDELFTTLTGRVLLAHHAGIEQGFTAVACRQVYGIAPDLPAVDTLALQARVLRIDSEHAGGRLRLWQARRHFGLPRYRAHQALTDALACAELYLAQVAEIGLGQAISYGTLKASLHA